jgi:hypothetical protein
MNPGDTRSPEPRKPNRAGAWVALAILIALGAVGAYVLFFKRDDAPPPPPPAPEAVDAGMIVEPMSFDLRVRELLRGLSSDPELEKWFAGTDLVRVFTAVVSTLSEGQSPRPLLPFLVPSGAFEVQKRKGKTYIDPKTYDRYAVHARVLSSLNTQGCVAAYKELKPAIDAAYRELAPPGKSFDQTLGGVLDRLIAAPIPEGEVEVVEQGLVYLYVDPAMEAQGKPQKHLMRMGPTHGRAIQAKLKELKAALELP